MEYNRVLIIDYKELPDNIKELIGEYPGFNTGDYYVELTSDCSDWKNLTHKTLLFFYNQSGCLNISEFIHDYGLELEEFLLRYNLNVDKVLLRC